MIQRARAFYAQYVRDFFAEYWLSIFAIAGALALLVLFVDPAPPDHISIAVGADEDAYRAYAEHYKAALARDKIILTLVPTTGAPENLKRLNDPAAGIDVAFLQDGLTNPQDSPHLSSLGSLYYEPLWIFYRSSAPPKAATAGTAKPAADTKQPAWRQLQSRADAAKQEEQKFVAPDRLSQLLGLRLAIGSGAGGTRQLAERLLYAAGVNGDNSKLVTVGGRQAADALLAGQVDAALFLSTLDAPWVQQLLVTPGIGLMSIDQSDATVRNFPFLHDLVLPHGAIDLSRNLPPQDIHLLAPTVTLVVRDDLHPALASLLVKAAIGVHSKPSLLNRENDFPADRDADLPLNAEAARYFKSGPPLLQKYMPFWLATWADRMGVVLLPLLAVLIPLVKLAPAVYGWRIRARVYHWYGELKFLEVQLRDAPETAAMPKVLERLDWIENQVNRIRLPLSFSNHLYFLREHIELVRNAIHRHAAHLGMDPAAIRAAEMAAAAKTASEPPEGA
ncbi:MAG: C4-dicarboxylate transporter substrate-binding protein [Betaproteobacteria bacterium]|nr:C4-dicarboxylate transporter substrate-binding protein [Betaproteobacteria bacterium]